MKLVFSNPSTFFKTDFLSFLICYKKNSFWKM